LEIYNIKDKLEYLEEIVELTHNEWGNRILSEEDYRVWLQKKIISIKSMLDRNDYCKLILLDEDNLVGFISLFPTEGDERSDLSPWYATMFVKKEYRGRGCSKILNDALLKESKKRGFERVYLKIDLNGYYEKFRCRVHARFRKWRKTV